MTQNAKITGANNTTDPIAARNALLAKAANANRNAAPAPAPAPDDILAQLAAMQAMMQTLANTNAELLKANAALKAEKPAEKPAKPAPAPENMGIVVKGNIMTITIDLSKDTGKDTANGANRIIAQQNSAVGPYTFEHAGKKHWLSCSVGRPYDNAAELRKAYKAAKSGK